MAELSEAGVQEKQEIKSGLSLKGAARRTYDTPNEMAGYTEGVQAEAWKKVGEGVGALGLIGAKLNEGRERLVADKIKKQMNEEHLNIMTNFQRFAADTEIENLDFNGMLWGFKNRHSGDDFKIGKSDKKGEPSVLIKDKPLEDYDLPASQLQELKKHHNKLEETAQNWLLQNIPIIQAGKDKFYLTMHASDAISKIDAIYNNPNNQERVYEGPIGMKEGDKPSLFRNQPYTLQMGKFAQNDINDILSDFDDEIAKRMDAGTLRLEDAIIYQREFAEQVLEREFLKDKNLDRNATFLKVQKKGYSLTRDLGRGTGELRKKILQEVFLPTKYTDVFMSTMSDQQTRERNADKIKRKNNLRKSLSINVQSIVESEKFWNNPLNTMDSVTELYKKDAGLEEHEAKALAWEWQKKNIISDAGVDKRLADDLIVGLRTEFINNPRKFESEFGEVKDDMAWSIKPDKLAKVLQQKVLEYHQPSDEYGPVEGEDIVYKYVKGMIRRYDKDGKEVGHPVDYSGAIKSITSGMIQGLLNVKAETDRNWEKMYYKIQLQGMIGDPLSEGFLISQFFEENPKTGRYVLRTGKDSLYDHDYNQYFDNDEEFGSVLQGLADTLNTKLKNPKKKLTVPALIRKRDSSFEGAMSSFNQQQIKAFSDLAQEQDPESESVRMGDPQDHMKNHLTEVALSLGYSEEQFNAMPDDVVDAELWSKNQKTRYFELMRVHDTLKFYFHSAKPAYQTSRAELQKMHQNINNPRSKEKLKNSYTTNVAIAVGKVLEKRISDLDLPNVYTTFYLECIDIESGKGDLNCAQSKILDYGIDINDERFQPYDENSGRTLEYGLGMIEKESDAKINF